MYCPFSFCHLCLPTPYAFSELKHWKAPVPQSCVTNQLRANSAGQAHQQKHFSRAWQTQKLSQAPRSFVIDQKILETMVPAISSLHVGDKQSDGSSGVTQLQQQGWGHPACLCTFTSAVHPSAIHQSVTDSRLRWGEPIWVKLILSRLITPALGLELCIQKLLVQAYTSLV